MPGSAEFFSDANGKLGSEAFALTESTHLESKNGHSLSPFPEWRQTNSSTPVGVDAAVLRSGLGRLGGLRQRMLLFLRRC